MITYLAIVHKVRSRGLLYAQLKQTEKAKIDLQQAAIIFSRCLSASHTAMRMALAKMISRLQSTRMGPL